MRTRPVRRIRMPPAIGWMLVGARLPEDLLQRVIEPLAPELVAQRDDVSFAVEEDRPRQRNDLEPARGLGAEPLAAEEDVVPRHRPLALAEGLHRFRLVVGGGAED